MAGQFVTGIVIKKVNCQAEKKIKHQRFILCIITFCHRDINNKLCCGLQEAPGTWKNYILGASALAAPSPQFGSLFLRPPPSLQDEILRSPDPPLLPFLIDSDLNFIL